MFSNCRWSGDATADRAFLGRGCGSEEICFKLIAAHISKFILNTLKHYHFEIFVTDTSVPQEEGESRCDVMQFLSRDDEDFIGEVTLIFKYYQN